MNIALRIFVLWLALLGSVFAQGSGFLTPEATRLFSQGKTRTNADASYGRDQLQVKSALAQMLLRNASRAEQTDPSFKTPWKTCAAWQTATAYRIGDVRTSAGGYYIAVTHGTSGDTAPTHVNGSAVSDGTGGVLWTYYGGPGAAGDDPDAPTVTSSNATPSSPLTNFWNPTVFPGKYRLLGGYPDHSAGLWWQPYAFTYNANGDRAAYGTAISFYTDAPKFAVRLNSNGVVRFVIDGRYLTFDNYNPYTQLSNNDGWVTFDFGKVRKIRLFQIESNVPSGPYFGGVRTTDLDSVWADSREVVKAAFVSDSLCAGSSYGPFLAGGTVPAMIGKALGWEDIRNVSRGGTGWMNPGPGGTPDFTYRQRLTEILAWGPQVICFWGSTNDLSSYTSGQVASEITLALQQIRASSDALVVIFGPWPINNGNVGTFNTAMANAVTAFADPLSRVRFVSLSAPGDGYPLLSGNWNNSAQNFNENWKLYFSNDGLHPPDIGSRNMANRFISLIRPIVYGLN